MRKKLPITLNRFEVRLAARGMRVFPAERRSAERTTPSVSPISPREKDTHVGSCSREHFRGSSQPYRKLLVDGKYYECKEETKENGCSKGLAYSGFHFSFIAFSDSMRDQIGKTGT